MRARWQFCVPAGDFCGNVFLVLRVAGTHYKMNDYDFIFDFKFFSASV